MKNWKLKLFEFKSNLSLDQLEISQVVEKHLHVFDDLSEKELTSSLRNMLGVYSYDSDVKGLFENLDEELGAKPLLYDLKDLYKKVERKNYGMLYRQPLNEILNIIAKDDDESRMESILNNLVIYDWVPEIKTFIINLTTDPTEKANLTSTGSKCSKVFTVVEEVENGHVAFIGDRWFYLSDKDIKQVLLSDVVKDSTKLENLYELEQALKIADFDGNSILFDIDENLNLSIDVDSGVITLNGEKIEKETSIESIFQSPIIPYMKKNLYKIIKTVIDNLDKIIDLDVVCKISSLTKLGVLYIFNYKDKLYLYSVDPRTGSSFYEYDSVNQLISDINKETGYDISNFVSNKLSKELKQFKKLEDKEKQLESKISEVNESIEELKENEELMNESSELKSAFDNLLIFKQELVKQLNTVKNEKIQEKKKI